MLPSPLPLSFLDTYSLSTSSLRCNALCMVISFLILLSIFFSDPLQKLVFLFFCPFFFSDPLQKLSWISNEGYCPSIYSFDNFLQHSFVSCSFMVLWRYSFLISSFISTCLMVSASKMPKCLKVSFSPSILILLWFGSSIPSIRWRLPLFITKIHPYVLTVYSNCVLFFIFLQIVWCRPCTLGVWSFLVIYLVCIWLCIFWVCG